MDKISSMYLYVKLNRGANCLINNDIIAGKWMGRVNIQMLLFFV